MELRQLRYFVQACDAVSFSEGSHLAHISQPALSRQIKLLEGELGVELFIRSARGIILTDAGCILKERASRLLNEVAILRHDVVSSTVVPRGELIVGTLTSLLAYLAAPALAGFREKYPEVSFRIIEGTSKAMRDAVAKGIVDIAFISLIEGQDDLEVCPLLSEQLFLVGHRDAGLEVDKPVALSALQHTPLILTARPNGLRLVVDRALGHLGSEGNVAFEVETLLLAIQLAQLKQGFTVFPYCAIDEYIQRGVVSAAPIEGMRMSWAMAYSRERALSTAARLFMECVQARSKEKVLAGMWPTATLAC